MPVITSAYHLDERLLGLPVVGRPVVAELGAGDLPSRLVALYQQVADAVARAVPSSEPVTVVSGDCTTSLAVLTGLQRAGLDPGVVWLDAHGDFNTPETTESGYVGGMPLAVAVGHDGLGLAAGLGLAPVAERRVVLGDGRDLDPRERELLDASAVRRVPVDALDATTVPDGPLYLHIDVDVLDAAAVSDLRYPVMAGPSVAAVVAAIERVRGTGRVVAVGLACTWTPRGLMTAAARAVVDQLGLTSQ